ncbi:MAG TPA: hypothetical protein VII64_12175 [Thermodesulfobacteriota bacterium]
MVHAKTLLILPFFILLAASPAPAYYFGGLDDYAAGVPSQDDKPSLFEQSGGDILYETFYAGSFNALDPENQALILDSEVPGFLGPDKVSMPVAISSDAAVDYCVGGECRRIGTEGWKSLSRLTQEELDGSRVVIMGYPEDRTRVITVIKE